MSLPVLQLKKREDKRLQEGHVWIYSNEIDNQKTPLKNFSPGEEVIVKTANQTFLGIAYVNPHSLIAGRLFSRKQNSRLNTEFFQTAIQKALTLREQLFFQPFYRLVFGESDALPGLVIDRYGQDFVAQLNTYGMELKKDAILSALQLVFPDLRSLLWRNDSAIRTQEGLDSYTNPAFGKVPETALIEENGVSFSLPLQEAQKTGWFFDHRLNRLRLQNYVKNKNVLDVFSYLGGWGIQAACFGAREVTCIDSSALACEWTEKNAHLNQQSQKVKVICSEAVKALQALHPEKRKFDVIVLDPPAFIKRRKDQREGLLAYQRINALALRLLNPDGILISGSCSMHLSHEDQRLLLQRAAIQTRCQLQILEQGHQGPDHPIHPAIPETDYLKALFLRKLEHP